MFSQAGVEDGVAVGLWRAVLEGAGEAGEEVGGFVEEGFGALGDEVRRGR